MDLSAYDDRGFDRGRPWWVEGLWLAVSALLFESWLPGSGWRRHILRLFGAEVGQGLVIKPGVKIKFPWRLRVGDHSWLGERAWIDNLAPVTIGAHCCISQDAYLCTGNHDWSRRDFALRIAEIVVAPRAWVGARAVVGPGVHIGEGAVIALGSVVSSDVTAWSIVAGSPAVEVKQRERAR